jgi:hypothetical protein
MDSHLKVITGLKPLQRITSNLICERHFHWRERKMGKSEAKREKLSRFVVFFSAMTGRGEENVAFESRALWKILKLFTYSRGTEWA